MFVLLLCRVHSLELESVWPLWVMLFAPKLLARIYRVKLLWLRRLFLGFVSTDWYLHVCMIFRFGEGGIVGPVCRCRFEVFWPVVFSIVLRMVSKDVKESAGHSPRCCELGCFRLTFTKHPRCYAYSPSMKGLFSLEECDI